MDHTQQYDRMHELGEAIMESFFIITWHLVQISWSVLSIIMGCVGKVSSEVILPQFIYIAAGIMIMANEMIKIAHIYCRFSMDGVIMRRLHVNRHLFVCLVLMNMGFLALMSESLFPGLNLCQVSINGLNITWTYFAVIPLLNYILNWRIRFEYDTSVILLTTAIIFAIYVGIDDSSYVISLVQLIQSVTLSMYPTRDNYVPFERVLIVLSPLLVIGGESIDKIKLVVGLLILLVICKTDSSSYGSILGNRHNVVINRRPRRIFNISDGSSDDGSSDDSDSTNTTNSSDISSNLIELIADPN